MAEVLEGTAIVSIDTSSNGSIKCLIWRKEDDEIVIKQKKLSLDKKNSGTNPFMPSRVPGAGRVTR